MQFFRLDILSNHYLVQIMRYCLVPRKYKERQKMLRKLFSFFFISIKEIIFLCLVVQ